MKKFLIMSYSISGMGGGQMYQYNKLKYMREQGFSTYIFYAIPGEIIIKEIKEIAFTKCVEVLNIHPLIIGKKGVKDYLNDMSFYLGSDNTDLIIECDNKTTSLWGELLAKEFQCISYSLIIDEKIGSIDKGLLDFFRLKRENNELKGLKNETYEMLFKGEEVPQDYQYYFPIPGNNVVADIDYPKDSISRSDLMICSIGRLDKAYVPILVEQVVSYAKKNPDIKIFFGLIGDSPSDKNKKEIKDKVKNSSNIQLHFFGSMYPIPEKLLFQFDVFISSAGSARVSGDRGLVTITIDSRDHMAIGIYQYETDNTVFRNNEPRIPISEKLKYTVENYDVIKSKLYIKPNENFNSIFRNHINYYNSHINNKKYFDVMSMKLSKVKLIEKIIYRLLGRKKYENIRKLVFLRK